MTEPTTDAAITPKTVLAAFRPREGLMIHEIAKRLFGTAAYDSERFRILKTTLHELHRNGRIETFRPSPTMSLRYRKPDPLTWPELSALLDLVDITFDESLTGRVRHQIKLAEKKLRAMIDSHAEVEAERIRNWVNAECIWRVEFNKAHGPTPRVNYVEASEGDTEQDVRRWQNMCVPTSVYVIDCRRADESDVDELLEMTREEEGW